MKYRDIFGHVDNQLEIVKIFRQKNPTKKNPAKLNSKNKYFFTIPCGPELAPVAPL